MNKRIIIRSFLELLIIVIVSYPLFYYAYKCSVPSTLGLNDYKSYYQLYQSWDYNSTPSPFNTRLISSYGTYLITKLNFAYDTKINFEVWNKDRVVFFSALFFNYLALIATCFLVYKIIQYKLKNQYYSFAFGLAYLFSFGTLFFTISPITDSLAGFLVALCLYYYLKKSYWIVLPIILSIFQREYIFFIFALLPTIKIIYEKSVKKDKYYTFVFVLNVACFIAYYILRNTFFFTNDYAYQIQIDSYLNNFIKSGFHILEHVKHSLLNQNLLSFYILVIVVKCFLRSSINKLYFITVLLLFLQSIFVGMMVQLGNNSARMFHFTAPIIIYYIALELYSLKNKI